MMTHKQSHRNINCPDCSPGDGVVHSAEWSRDPTTGDLIEVWQCMGCGQAKPRRDNWERRKELALDKWARNYDTPKGQEKR
jgi:uncharacterized Zn finger protein